MPPELELVSRGTSAGGAKIAVVRITLGMDFVVSEATAIDPDH